MSALYIGIDVSKDFSTAQAIDGNGNKCFYLELAMTADGFYKLLKAITSHGEDIAQVTVAMESTGCYHINLFSFLRTRESAVLLSILFLLPILPGSP